MEYWSKFYSMHLENDVTNYETWPTQHEPVGSVETLVLFFAVCRPKFTKLFVHAQDGLLFCSTVSPPPLSLSPTLSGACQVDVAVSTSSRHADLSIARRLAVARPKLRGRRSSSIVLRQDCLGLSTLQRQSLGGPRMHDWRAREWSCLWSARLRCPKKNRRRPRIVSDKNGCPVRDRTSSFSVWRYLLSFRRYYSRSSWSCQKFAPKFWCFGPLIFFTEGRY